MIVNCYSILKRGLMGICQRVGKQRLKRYICDFDFLYNTRKTKDHERPRKALQGIWGKRLTDRRIGERRVALGSVSRGVSGAAF